MRHSRGRAARGWCRPGSLRRSRAKVRKPLPGSRSLQQLQPLTCAESVEHAVELGARPGARRERATCRGLHLREWRVRMQASVLPAGALLAETDLVCRREGRRTRTRATRIGQVADLCFASAAGGSRFAHRSLEARPFVVAARWVEGRSPPAATDRSSCAVRSSLACPRNFARGTAQGAARHGRARRARDCGALTATLPLAVRRLTRGRRGAV
jgi:hypothetical protein